MEIGKCKGVRRPVTADDVTATTITLNSDTQAITGAIAVLRDAAGAVKAWDGAITVTADTVTLDNTGATDFADTDVFDVVMF